MLVKRIIAVTIIITLFSSAMLTIGFPILNGPGPTADNAVIEMLGDAAVPDPAGAEGRPARQYEHHAITFDMPRPAFRECSGFQLVEMDDVDGLSSSFLFSEGNPQLPKYTRTMTLPKGTRIISSRMTDISRAEMPAPGTIYPVPRSQPHVSGNFWEGADELYYDGSGFTRAPATPFMDDEIYGSGEQYPDSWFKVRSGTGRDPITDEIVLFLMVDLYPIRYSPRSSRLEVASRFSIEIVTEEPAGERNNMRSGPGTDMVLIGPESMRYASGPLLEYKSSTGLDTLYISLDEIYNSAFFPVQGSDNPEKIKYFLRDALDTWGIKYACLVGDSDVCPVRYARIPDGFDDSGAHHLDGTDVPSDVYYADIYNSTGAFCAWNDNGNGWYGEEEEDGCDMFYDLYIGRLPAGTGAELEDMIDDIIYYEQNTLGSDWFMKANLHGMDTFGWDSQGIPEGEYTLDHIADSGYLTGFSISKFYETEGTLDTAAVVGGMNAGAGFAAFSDHGDHHCWGATGGGDGVFERNDVAGLTNGRMLPVVTFDACLCASFDNELQPTLWVDNPGESISETMLLNTNGGGIAAIGCTRVGYGDGGANYIKHRSGFIDVHLYRNFQEGKRTPGRMLAGAVTYYMTEVGNDDTMDHKTLAEYICLGDPSLSIGGMTLESSVASGTDVIAPGSSGMYAVRVNNSSPFSESVTIDFSRLPEGFLGAAPQSTPVTPEGSVNITLSVTPPKGLLAGEVYNLPVGVLSRDRGRFLNLTCVIGEEYGVSLSSPLTDDTTDPGVEVPFWVNVKNTGNTEDTFELGFLENMAGWEVWSETGNITLPPFSMDNVTIYIRPSNESRFGMRRITVTATSLGSNGTIRVTQKFNLTIRHIYGMTVPEINGVSALPGEQFYLGVPIWNTGNGEERFDLEIPSSPPNWTTSLSEYHFEVDPFSTDNATVEFTVPTDALAGDYEIELKVALDEGGLEQKITIGVVVEKVYLIDLRTGESAVRAENTAVTNFTLRLVHGSNFKDSYTIAVEQDHEELTCQLSEDKLEMEPGSEEQTILGVTPGPVAVAGDYNLTVSCVSDSDPACNESLELKVTVLPRHSCTIKTDTTDASLLPGEDVNVSFTVDNTGNSPDSIRVSAHQPASLATKLAVPVMELDAFSGGSGSLMISALPDSLAGIYRVNVSADATSGTDQENIFFVIEVEVLPVRNISISPSFIPRKLDKDELFYTFFVTNEGNCADTYVVEYTGKAAEWLVSPTYELNISARGDDGITVNVVPPEDTDSGEYDLGVLVRSSADGTVKDNATLCLKIEKEGLAGILGSSGLSGNFLYGAAAVAAAFIIFIVLIVVIVIARRKKKNRKKTGPKSDLMKDAALFDDEKPAPSYEELYGNLPKVAQAGGGSRSGSGSGIGSGRGGGGTRKRPVKAERYEDFGINAEVEVEVDQIEYDDGYTESAGGYGDTGLRTGESIWASMDEVEEEADEEYGMEYEDVFSDVMFGEDEDEQKESVYGVEEEIDYRDNWSGERRLTGDYGVEDDEDDEDDDISELVRERRDRYGKKKKDERPGPLPDGGPLDSLFDFAWKDDEQAKDEVDVGVEDEEDEEDEEEEEFEDEDDGEEGSVSWD